MNNLYLISKTEWNNTLVGLLNHYTLFAPLQTANYIDYKIISKETVPQIIYNRAKPISPLKVLFLPVKQNVTIEKSEKKTIVLGAPSCDTRALELLDKTFVDDHYTDTYYKNKRDNTIIICTDCHEIQDNCHCLSHGGNPFPEKNYDISLSTFGENVFVIPNTFRGEEFIEENKIFAQLKKVEITEFEDVLNKRSAVKRELARKNAGLPNLDATAELIKTMDKKTWIRFSSSCVSCGGCATICPTCTCFTLIDRPGFEKIRQTDSCQYPGFEKIASGDDPLRDLSSRFKNRFFCKYVWKPEKYKATACTGCGRCIDVCIGKINKNKMFLELETGVS